MDRLKKIDEVEFQNRMWAAFQQTMKEVVQAVNAARDGHLIDDSEERCRDVLGEFRRTAFETAAQMRVEATEADPSFSPSGGGKARGGEPLDPELQRPDPGASASGGKRRRRDGRAGG